MDAPVARCVQRRKALDPKFVQRRKALNSKPWKRALYSAMTPSCRGILNSASKKPLYWMP